MNRTAHELDGISLRQRAPGKVNLCLFLGPVRTDGRHELVTLFESVSLHDELTVTSATGDSDEVICAEVDSPNLVAEALAGLRARGWRAPPVRVEITKRIPIAAGMGGGSADAAALLRLAPELSPAAADEVAALAAELGADVPSQLTPGLSLGTGAGEVLEPLAPLVSHALAIVPLPERLVTATVYAQADRLGLPRRRDELEARRLDLERALGSGGPLPTGLMVNDLEPAAWELCPRIGDALEATREAGAEHVLVCGSGPTVAGVWWGEDAEARAEAAAAALAPRFPGATAVRPVSSQTFGKIPGG